MPHPAVLRGYEDVQEGFAERIMRMAEKSNDAKIAATVEPIRAESMSLRAATVAVAYFPWVGIGGAVVLTVLGHDVAALVSGVIGALSAGPQIISSTRRKN